PHGVRVRGGPEIGPHLRDGRGRRRLRGGGRAEARRGLRLAGDRGPGARAVAAGPDPRLRPRPRLLHHRRRVLRARAAELPRRVAGRGLLFGLLRPRDTPALPRPPPPGGGGSGPAPARPPRRPPGRPPRAPG